MSSELDIDLDIDPFAVNLVSKHFSVFNNDHADLCCNDLHEKLKECEQE